MQYVFNDRRTYITSIEFRNTLPIANVEKLRYFKEEGITGAFTKKEFRWSFDNVIWEPWQTLTQGNLTSINFQDQNNLYLHIKYSRTKVIDANISSFYIVYDSKTVSPSSPDSSIIDADLLQGQSGDYYLNRENQYGPFTDLNVLNVADVSSSVGVYYGRSDSSLGTNIYIKSIRGVDGIKVYDSSTSQEIIIETSLNIITTYDTLLPDDLKTPEDVGGIPSDTSVAYYKGRSFTTIIDDLLFPTIYPTYVAPSQVLSRNQNYLQEVSILLPIQFTSTFSQGQILVNGVYQNTRSGLPTTYYWTGTGFIPDPYPGVYSETRTISIPQGLTTWGCDPNYLQGPQPYDNKGNPYGSPLSAGSLGYSYVSIEGVYPIFATTSIINTLTKQSLVSMLTSTYVPSSSGMTLVAEVGGKQKFEIPVAWPYTDLSGIQTYNTVSAQWEYQYGSAGASLTAWTVSDTTETIQGNSVNYKRYTYNGTDRSSITIRLIM